MDGYICISGLVCHFLAPLLMNTCDFSHRWEGVVRIRDPTRKSLIEFRGPVFPIDVTGQDVGIPSLFHLKFECGKTSAPGHAQRKMPGNE